MLMVNDIRNSSIGSSSSVVSKKQGQVNSVSSKEAAAVKTRIPQTEPRTQKDPRASSAFVRPTLAPKSAGIVGTRLFKTPDRKVQEEGSLQKRSANARSALSAERAEHLANRNAHAREERKWCAAFFALLPVLVLWIVFLSRMQSAVESAAKSGGGDSSLDAAGMIYIYN